MSQDSKTKRTGQAGRGLSNPSVDPHAGKPERLLPAVTAHAAKGALAGALISGLVGGSKLNLTEASRKRSIFNPRRYTKGDRAFVEFGKTRALRKAVGGAVLGGTVGGLYGAHTATKGPVKRGILKGMAYGTLVPVPGATVAGGLAGGISGMLPHSGPELATHMGQHPDGHKLASYSALDMAKIASGDEAAVEEKKGLTGAQKALIATAVASPLASSRVRDYLKANWRAANSGELSRLGDREMVKDFYNTARQERAVKKWGKDYVKAHGLDPWSKAKAVAKDSPTRPMRLKLSRKGK